MSANSNSIGTLPPGVQLAPNWQDLAVDKYREALSVSAACREAGISRQTFYNYLKADPMFAQRIQDAKEDAIDKLQASAYQRATDGVVGQRRTFYDPKTGQVSSVQESIVFSDTLAAKFLEAHRGDTYRPKSSMELSGTVTQVQVDLNELRREKLTLAVQNGLNMGMSLREVLEYLSFRGVPKEHLALVRGEDLVIPAIEVSPTGNGAGGNGNGDGSDK